MYSVLLHSYAEDEDRTYLKLEKQIAPVGVSVFPLVNQDDLVGTAHKIRNELRNQGYNSRVRWIRNYRKKICTIG